MRRTILTALLLLLFGVGVAIDAAGAELLAWYKLDETSGTLAADSSGNGNAAQLENGVAWDSVVDTSRAYDFGPSSAIFNKDSFPEARIVAPHSDTLNVGTESVTMSFMLKKASTSADQVDYLCKGSIVAGDADGGGNRYEMYEKGDFRACIDRQDGDQKIQKVVSSVGMCTGQWAHVAAVVDRTASQIHIYYDGVEQTGSTSGVWPTGSIDDAAGLIIGNYWAPSNTYVGSMDDVRIYRGTMTQSEIQDLYPYPTPTPTATPTPSPAGVVHWEVFE